MPFRSKLKAAFGRSPSTAAASPTEAAGTTTAVTDAASKKDKAAKKSRWGKKDAKWQDWPEHVYKPHEIPPPKYKRPPAKEHTKNLEKFSWDTPTQSDTEGRRASATSGYSPMGSRLASRRSSEADPLAVADAVEAAKAADGAEAEAPEAEATEAGQEAPGLHASRQPTATTIDGIDPAAVEDGGPLDRSSTVRAREMPDASLERSETVKAPAKAEDPFDGADLAKALTAIHHEKPAVLA